MQTQVLTVLGEVLGDPEWRDESSGHKRRSSCTSMFPFSRVVREQLLWERRKRHTGKAVGIEFLKTAGQGKWLRCSARTKVRKTLSGGNPVKSASWVPPPWVTRYIQLSLPCPTEVNHLINY